MKRFLCILSLLLLAPCVFAAPSFFTPSANDQSMYFLGSLFGDVGNVLTGWGSSKLLMHTFYYFNQAVLVLGCIVIVYTLIVSTVNTSHHGEMMGQKWNSVWIPMRSAIGFALLLPIGSGQTYAVVQAMVMWVIVQGVGAADYLWSNMVDQVVAGDATFEADTASSTSASDTIMSAFEYYVCAMQLVQMQNVRKYRTNENRFYTGHYQDNTGISKHNNNYGWEVPRIFFIASNSTASQPNTNFWTFGFDNPTGWTNQTICGTITTPASTSGMKDAMKNYYDNQRDILSAALGLAQSTGGSTQHPLSNGSYTLYLPHSNDVAVQGTAPPYYVSYDSSGTFHQNQAAWGKYGGNWLGDYGKGTTPDDRSGSLNGKDKGLQIMLPYHLNADGTKSVGNGPYARDANGKLLYEPISLPTVAYLAELLSQNIDAGSPTANPTSQASTNTSAGSTSTDDNGNGDFSVAPTSQVAEYVQQQLALIAQAYTDATAANYAAYQSALAGPSDAPQPGSKMAAGAADAPQPGSKMAAGAAAAKFNGWASAGAFYLDMAKVLQATTSDIAATNDYSYGALACVKDVGESQEAHDNNMMCKDARAPSDVGGIRRSFNKDDPKGSGQYGTQLGDALTEAQNATNQALGLMINYDGSDTPDEPDPGPCQNTQNTPAPPPGPITPGGQTTTSAYIYNSTGYYYNANDPDNPYQQKCGIYNSTGNGAFSTSNMTKPKFPKMIINPIAWYKYVNGMMIYNFAQTLAPMLNMGESTNMKNPILVLRQSGIRLLNTSSKLYHAGLTYMWVSGLVSYVASNWSPIAGAAMSTFNWAASMATAMVAAMMAMGAIMAYYFPMIPYLVFTFATIQWLILTVEAMTAAPLMALGILHPEGTHEVFGHSSAGIAILSTVFLRPSLMIVGYFAATLMCYVVVLLINAGFFFAAGSMMSGDTSTGSVFGCVVVWMMYLNTVMIAINKSFSLIYHIPDHVTKWIGIHEQGGSDVEQMMGQVKEGVKQGGDLGKGAMDSGASSRTGTRDTAAQKRKKKGGGGEE
jgi:hypothetical protein